MNPLFNSANCGGQWVVIIARNPPSVCCPESILVSALRSIGVLPHPAFGFQSIVDEAGPFWRWVVSEKSKDGIYETASLIKWWHDPVWQLANPNHEWRIARSILLNMARQAAEIRDAIPIIAMHRGKFEAQIPSNASPARRQHLIDQLEQRIPFGAPFTESPPAAEAAA